MTAVRITVVTREGARVEHLVHVVNGSRHALTGAVRAARRKYPHALDITAIPQESAVSFFEKSGSSPPARRIVTDRAITVEGTTVTFTTDGRYVTTKTFATDREAHAAAREFLGTRTTNGKAGWLPSQQREAA
jgi:hypothetical protein